MKVKHYILVCCILPLLVAACGRQPAPTVIGVSTTTSIQKPELGKAMVTGKVISTISNQPLKTAVWLAEVVRQGEQGAYVLDTASSPAIYTDENGIFLISNIIPGEYVLVVGDPESRYEIITESSGKVKVWNIPADQIYDVGELKVTLTK
jgi:hypothetical protein